MPPKDRIYASSVSSWPKRLQLVDPGGRRGHEPQTAGGIIPALKSTISLCVAACLIASPFAGCATTRGPRQINEDLAYSGSPALTWSRVGEIAPGAEIMVTT